MESTDNSMQPIQLDPEFNGDPKEETFIRLMKAMLNRAILDCMGYEGTLPEDRRSAYRWIFEDSNVEFSFLWVMLHLGHGKHEVVRIRTVVKQAIGLCPAQAAEFRAELRESVSL